MAHPALRLLRRRLLMILLEPVAKTTTSPTCHGPTSNTAYCRTSLDLTQEGCMIYCTTSFVPAGQKMAFLLITNIGTALALICVPG